MILEAMTLMGRSGSGRAKPPRILAQAPDGTDVEVYVKSPQFYEIPNASLLEREWMAAKVGQALELPCGHPCKVRVSPEFIATVIDSPLRNQLTEGPEILFGSINEGPQWYACGEATKLPRASLPLMTNVYLFDTLIQNWDRCLPNPNILVKGNDIVLIDHGDAFADVTELGGSTSHGRSPWEPDGIGNFDDDFFEHPFWSKLRPKSHVDFKIAAQAWKNLPDDTFELAASEIPTCWSSRYARAIARYLTSAVSHIDEVVAQIEHNLNK